MKQRVRRVTLSALAILLTAVFALTGCGGSSTSNSSQSSSSASQSDAASTESKLEPYTLDMYYATSVEAPADLKLVQEEMSKLLTDKINANIVLHPISSGTFGDKTNLLYSSNDKVDIVWASSSTNFIANVSKGAYLAMDDLLNKYGKDVLEICGDYIAGSKVNGKIYAVPAIKDMGVYPGYIFNKALVDKYKFDLTTIKSYKDIEPMLEVIKKNEPDITPLCESNRSVGWIGGLDIFDNIYLNVAIPIDSKDSKVVNKYSIDKYIEVLKWNHQMYEKGYINKSSLTDTDMGPMQVGKAFCQPYNLKPGNDKELSTSWGFDVVQVETALPFTSATQTQGALLAISKNSKDPDRAAMAINLLYTDEKLLNTFVFGIEGKHYVKKGENIIDYPEGVTAKTVGYTNNGWRFGNQLINYVFASEDPKKWDAYKEFNAKSVKSPLLGFTFDSTPVAAQAAAVNNAIKQYEKALFCGAADPEKVLPEYLAAEKAAGGDAVIAEVQKQIDEWNKTR